MISEDFPNVDARRLRFAFVASNAATRQDRGLVVVFTGSSEQPVAFAKVALAVAGQEAIRNEFRSLLQVWPRRAALAFRLPKPIGLHLDDEGGFALFSAVAGRTLTSRTLTPRRRGFSDRRAATLFSRFAAKAVDVSGSLARLRAPNEGGAPIIWSDVVEEFSDQLIAGTDLKHTLQDFANRLAADDARALPCWQHGDLAMGNLLFSPTDVGVVDWEKASEAYPAWFDQTYALASLAFFGPDRHHPGANLARVFDDRGVVGSSLREMTEAHWKHDIPLGQALALTAIESALASNRLGRGGTERWIDLTAALLGPAPSPGTRWISPMNDGR
jgi:hypothetical protein